MDEIRMKKIFFILIGLFIAGNSWAQLADVHGFVETAVGARVSSSGGARHEDLSLLESRLQLKKRHFFGAGYLAEKSGVLDVKVEGLVDGYFGGKTALTVREMNLALTPLRMMDIKIGRQVLTWGTGDYLFINDMFPKDYISFFSGREDEYLKKPSDAVRLSMYFDEVNVDAVLIPLFEPNTIADGDRLSFYDSFQGGIAGEASDRFLAEPAHQPENMEYALRAFRTFGSYELAGYFFRGFYKNPQGYQDEAARRLFYPRVNVYGSSLRGPFLGGIGNVETGYYDSRQDSRGDDRLIENSMWKTMAGYSKDLGSDWNIGLQYLFEQRLDYGRYAQNLLNQDLCFDRYRHVVTQRISKLFKNQTVEWSVFNFYSPSDRDGYLRSSVSYQMTDQWTLTAGVNFPWGDDDYTEFGQMKKNQNIYARVRYSF
jgi:hypothetical protein